jgi:autophagy-related protein 33
VLRPSAPKTSCSARKQLKERERESRKTKNKQRQMDASYEVLGSSDRDSEGTMSGEEMEVEEEEKEEEEINGEEVREQMEGFQQRHMMRTAIAGIGFMMSVIGIWGDGSTDVVLIEMSA